MGLWTIDNTRSKIQNNPTVYVFFIWRSKYTGLRNYGKSGSQLTYRHNRPLDMAKGTFFF